MKFLKPIALLCFALSTLNIASAEEKTDSSLQRVSYDDKTEFVERDASFNEKPPMFTEKMKKNLSKAKWVIGDYKEDMILPAKAPAETVKIMGKAEATEKEMLDFLLKNNPNPRLTCSPAELVHNYYVEALLEGIRPDLALCQSFKETGYYNYGGDVRPEQNNYCGLGATGGGNHGLVFPNSQIGARAHIQHIKVYASKEPPKTKIVDPRYEIVKRFRPDIFGSVTNWTGLNGRWAVPGTYYGQDIVKKLNYALAPAGGVEAVKKGESMINANPIDHRAYAYRGIAYFAEGDYENALYDFSFALLCRETWESYYNLGILYIKKGDIHNALASLTNASDISPNEEEIYYNRGLIYFNLGEYKKAKEDFTKVLSINPHIAEVATYKGITEIKLEHYEEAWADFYKASQINTVNPIVKANRAILFKCSERK